MFPARELVHRADGGGGEATGICYQVTLAGKEMRGVAHWGGAPGFAPERGVRVVDKREDMARILITGLEAYGYHGCTPREREEGQVFLVDVELEYDASAAVRDDDLSLAVDYDRLAQGIRDIVAGEPFRLIESLAAEIGRYVMAGTAATRVLVRVHKPEAPLGCEVRDVAVEMAFRRGGENEGPAPPEGE